MHIVPKRLKDECLAWYRLMMEVWIVDKGFPRPDTRATKLMEAIKETWPDEIGLIEDEIKGCEDNSVDPLTGGELALWRLNPRGV